MKHVIRAGLPALFALALSAAPAAAEGETPPSPTAAAPAAPAASTTPAPPSAPGTEGKQFKLPRAGDKGTQIQLISGLCEVEMKNMSPLACKCLAEQALTKLSDPQRDYLIASVVSPPVADRMLADHRVAGVDQVAIFGFLNATSDACASGTFDPAKAAAAAQATPATPPVAAPTAPTAPAPAPAAPAVP